MVSVCTRGHIRAAASHQTGVVTACWQRKRPCYASMHPSCVPLDVRVKGHSESTDQRSAVCERAAIVQ
eukprot:365711-Chlamydomonas_euryale.AAC.14